MKYRITELNKPTSIYFNVCKSSLFVSGHVDNIIAVNSQTKITVTTINPTKRRSAGKYPYLTSKISKRLRSTKIIIKNTMTANNKTNKMFLIY